MFERAPEPSDINWENMGLTSCDVCIRQFNSLIATLIMLGGSFVAIWFIKDYARSEQERIDSGDFSKSDNLAVQTLNENLSIATAVAIAIINAILPVLMRRFSLYERHETNTDLSLTLALKLSLVKFLNTSVIYAVVHSNAEDWFSSGNLVNDVFTVLCFAAFAPLINLVVVFATVLVQKCLICK